MIVSIKELKITEKRYNQIIDLYNELALVDSRKLIDKQVLTYSLLIKIILGLPRKHNIYLYIDENDDIIGGITLLIEQKSCNCFIVDSPIPLRGVFMTLSKAKSSNF